MGEGERSERWAGSLAGEGERSERWAGSLAGEGVWAAMRCDSASPSGLDPQRPPLAAELDGVIAVGAAPPAWASLHVPVAAQASDGQCLAAAIRALPVTAAAVAWCEVGTPVAEIRGLWQRLGACDAAVRAAPVTDAIKQVRDGLIHRGVDRDGLCVPALPLLLRASADLERLLTALDDGHDPVAAVALAELEVRIVLGERPLLEAHRVSGP